MILFINLLLTFFVRHFYVLTYFYLYIFYTGEKLRRNVKMIFGVVQRKVQCIAETSAHNEFTVRCVDGLSQLSIVSQGSQTQLSLEDVWYYGMALHTQYL